MFHMISSFDLDSISPWVQCTLFVILFIVTAMLGLNIFNRCSAAEKRPSSNEVPGLIFGAISTLYSLVLAFVIVAAWGDYEKLNDTIQRETDKLSGIMTHSSALPDSLRKTINNALAGYCEDVIHHEWHMNNDPTSYYSGSIHPLRMDLFKVHPRNTEDASNLSVIDQELSSVSDLRRDRLNHNQSHIPSAVWFVLGAGSVGLIVFSFLFHTGSRPRKRFCLSALSGCMAICFYLVYILDHPFGSATPVSNQPYVNVLDQLKQNNLNTLK